MLHEVALAGFLLPPILPLVMVAMAVFALLHWGLEKWGIYRFFWHPVLAATAMFLVVLALLLGLWQLLL